MWHRALRPAQFARCLVVVVGVHVASAQSCLVLSAPAFTGNGSAYLEISLLSPRERRPAALQWTLQVEPSTLASLAIEDGPALTSAGKTAICYHSGENYHCLAVGSNARTIGNGIIAKLTAVMIPGSSAVSIQLDAPMAASPEGYFLPVQSKVLFSRSAVPPIECQPRWRGPTGK